MPVATSTENSSGNPKIRRLVLEGADPRRWGEQHGEALRDEIHALYAIRRDLMLKRTDLGDEETLLALAHRHLPVLRDFDPAVADELIGIGRGADISLEKLAVLNHYTDMRDLSKADLHDDGGCSVVFAPGEQGPLLGQTWDMHGSAADYVLLLEIPSVGEGTYHTLLFTVAGCVGMTGLTSAGVGITINNLNSTDAKIGVLWPALVRRALKKPSALKARDVVLEAPLGSGHHYSIADDESFFGIETSGSKKKITQAGADQVHLHTNHCLDAEMESTARVLSTTTRARLETLEERTARSAPSTAAELYELLGAVSYAGQADDPDAPATCGAFVMDVHARRVLACQGVPAAAADSLVIELSS